jgi:hypothetical protein
MIVLYRDDFDSSNIEAIAYEKNARSLCVSSIAARAYLLTTTTQSELVGDGLIARCPVPRFVLCLDDQHRWSSLLPGVEVNA